LCIFSRLVDFLVGTPVALIAEFLPAAITDSFATGPAQVPVPYPVEAVLALRSRGTCDAGSGGRVPAAWSYGLPAYAADLAQRGAFAIAYRAFLRLPACVAATRGSVPTAWSNPPLAKRARNPWFRATFA
jgi:hypothetical protein